ALHHRGDLELALRHYRGAFAAETAPERRARIAVQLATVALARGGQPAQTADGGGVALAGDDGPDHWLDEAEKLARSADLPEVLWRTLRLRGQAAFQQAGDESAARAFFEQAGQVFLAQADRLRDTDHRASYRGQMGSV